MPLLEKSNMTDVQYIISLPNSHNSIHSFKIEKTAQFDGADRSSGSFPVVFCASSTVVRHMLRRIAGFWSVQGLAYAAVCCPFGKCAGAFEKLVFCCVQCSSDVS